MIMEKNVDTSVSANMRLKGEIFPKNRLSVVNANHSEASVLNTSQLQVQQMELERQNQELMLDNETEYVAKEKYIEIYDNAPLGYFTLSSNSEIIETNLMGAKMLGEERKSLQNKRLVDFVSERTKPIFFDFMVNVFTGSTKEFCEVIFQINNKTSCRVSISGIISKNRKQCFIKAIDITEHRKAEMYLRKNQKLTELYDTKDKLYSIIAHDLRTPFISILGFSEILMKKAKNNNDDEIAVFSELINSSANTTLQLLDNLLNWARSQTGQISFNTEKLNLSDEIQEIIESFNPIAKSKSISIKFLKSKKFEIYADKNMVHTILRNLIQNAIKFTFLNGEIVIQARKDNERIIVTISDNGVGMDQETMDKLFCLDKQSTLGTAKEHGSGLGLLVCKEFVEKHGGTIGVESEPGNGSIFNFTLPAK